MALATVDDVRKFLSLNASQDEDLLQRLVDGASAFVLAYMNRTSIEVETYTETYDGSGSQTLCPNNFPIKSVASLSINNNAILAATTYHSAGFKHDTIRIILQGHRFTPGLMNVAVTYDAGYDTLPADLTQAVVEIVAEKYQRRLRMGVTSKSIGQESISYSQNDILPHCKLVLNQYSINYIHS
jgi:Phage gp6-like head-tail connector protein